MLSRGWGDWVRVFHATASALFVCSTTLDARGDDGRAANPPATNARAQIAYLKFIEPVPTWSIRVSLAVGAPVNSDQEKLLDLEGYGGARWHTSLGVSHKLSDVVGLGGLALFGWRSAEAERKDNADYLGAAPNYGETLVALGAQLPLTFGVGRERKVLFFVTPWAGAGLAKAEFYDGGSWQAGPAFGGTTGMFFPRIFLGFGFGAYWIPLPPPGDAGGHNDFGMLHLSLLLGADVG